MMLSRMVPYRERAMGAAYNATRVFFEGGVRYTLVRPFDAGAGERPLRGHEARWVLARILRPDRGADITAAYRGLLRGPLSVAVEDDVHRMREALLAAVDAGWLLLFEVRLVGSSTRREVEEEAVARGLRPEREEKTWIEIVLMDDRDPPKPVSFARYRVELPDGSARDGMLDQHGKARVDGIDPGTCQVGFPGLDGRDWS
jgi:hypothetical protein